MKKKTIIQFVVGPASLLFVQSFGLQKPPKENFMRISTLKELHTQLLKRNGGNLPKDTPDSKGVAWHEDQDNNLFFSADFGKAGRWMTTNLSAKTYAAGAKHLAGRTLVLPSGDVYEILDKAFYGYPNLNEGNLSESAFYESNPRVGLLYNWDAATGGKGGKTGELHNVEEKRISHGKTQGICPDGWHLPNDSEWILLLDEVFENPEKYSTGDSKNIDRAFRDPEPLFKISPRGSSKSPIDGGFGIVLSGTGNDKAYSIGESASFWSASSAHSQFSPTVSRQAYAYHITQGDSGLRNNQNKRSQLFSVRCVKD
ncbi:MAG: hypothetical protein EAS48_10180 [Chryseobacterium sp.]|nr:MAG: hypothetical protein EAS48_10180 [Chryseobacterium sp.]